MQPCITPRRPSPCTAAWQWQAVTHLEREWGTKVVQGTPDKYGSLPIMPLPNGAREPTCYLVATCGDFQASLCDAYKIEQKVILCSLNHDMCFLC